jgi:hypothetical protein
MIDTVGEQNIVETVFLNQLHYPGELRMQYRLSPLKGKTGITRPDQPAF